MRFSILMATLALLAVGCGRNTAPVSGRVTLDNEPLANATVTFFPDSEETNPGPGSEGKTNANGEYTLKLMTKEGGDGAMLGKHKVKITAYRETAAEGQPALRKGFGTPLVPPQYNAQSTLTFEVKSGGNATANFDLASEEGRGK